MGKKVIVTEKPSVAATYARILGVSNKEDGYYENEEYIITWCIGHLVTLSYPEEYDAQLKKWKLETLPFIPETYKYSVITKVAPQFKIIKKLYNRSDVDMIYYAGDSGREGIYIQALVRQMAGHNSSAEERVVWIDSQTDEEILRGIREAGAFDMPRYKNLTASGYERAIEDYSTGINFSRLLSLKYAPMLNYAAALTKYTPISVGRVMSCVLGMVVNKERSITNFKSVPFYRIGNGISWNGINLAGDWKAVEGSKYLESPLLYDEKGFKKQEDAQKCIEELPQIVVIEKVEKSIEKKTAPTLFNLAELQAECSKRFKISPDETLTIAQSLYEKKLTTYPRTDARVLTTAIAKEVSRSIEGLGEIQELTDISQNIISNCWYQKELGKKYVDDSKVTDHYAIIPTGEALSEICRLSALERDVFMMVAKRFLSIFYPPAEYLKVLITERAGREYFFAGGKILKDAGFLKVVGTAEKGLEKEEIIKSLASLREGSEFDTQYHIKNGETTPPKRYTSGTMILAMENAGQLIEEEELRAQIKNCGIGTAATRAETIKKLVRLGYIQLNSKTQVVTPTQLGYMIYEVIDVTIPALLNPRMTASWEKGLDSIADGSLDAGDYRKKMEAFVFRECEKIKEQDFVKEITSRIRPYAKKADFENIGEMFQTHSLPASCPDCGGVIMTVPFGFACENYKKEGEGCRFAIGQVAGVRLTDQQVIELITDGHTRIIEGFQSKKKDVFSAVLVLHKNEEGNSVINFDFSIVKPSTLTDVKCPICGSDIYITKFGYGCAAYKKEDENSCKFFIGKIAGKMLTEFQVKTLIEKKKAGPVRGFVSKNGKSFDAVLVMKEDGKVCFDFPEVEDVESKLLCPKCQKNLVKTQWYYECACGYKISHTIAGKKLKEEEMRHLISGTTGMLRGFVSKKGKRFAAILKADENGTVTFVFDDN